MIAASALAELERRLDEQMVELAVPGAAVGLLLDGQQHILCRGVTNLRHPLPVDTDTLFQVGSTTKTVTATAVMRLVEQGRLDLDQPVRTWLPDLELADQAVAARVTARHLLTHTGGWESDMPRDFGRGDAALAEFVAHMAELPQVAPLGLWGYQNSAFTLAGRLVEVVTGLSYEQAVRELVLAPLGMEHSVFSASDAIVHAVAVGHHGDIPAVPWELDRSMNPAGGLASGVADQLAYARFHLSSGEGVLRAGTLESMRQPQAEAGGGYASAMGLGWLLQSTPGLIAHGGSTNGQESAFALVPERGFAFTVLTNSTSGAVLQRSLTKWALRNLARVTPVRPDLAEAEGGATGACVGTYRGGAWVVTVTSGATGPAIRVEPSRATLRRMPDAPAYGPLAFTLYRGGRFQVAAGEMRGASGEFLGEPPTHLRLNGRLHLKDASV